MQQVWVSSVSCPDMGGFVKEPLSSLELLTWGFLLCVHCQSHLKYLVSADTIIQAGASDFVSNDLLQIVMRWTESRKFFMGGDGLLSLFAVSTGCDTILDTWPLFSNVCQTQCLLSLHVPSQTVCLQLVVTPLSPPFVRLGLSSPVL